MGLALVELHDHLDGGLRPGTLIDLARRRGVTLISQEESLVTQEIQKNRGSLVNYLKAFEWTLPVMQEAEDLERIALEAVEDWARAVVIYGELRMAPQLHQQKGLSLIEVLKAVRRGMEEGTRRTGTEGRLIACGLRDREGSLKTLEAADKLRDWGVVGFDMAGPEAGWPLEAHRETFRRARDRGMPVTIHAGEAAGPESIREALDMGARRIGHGVSLVRDPELLQEVRRRGIHIEVCLSSNLHTGAAADLQCHPVHAFATRGVKFSLCTDNRLMSLVSLQDEVAALKPLGNYDEGFFRAVNRAALEASFLLPEEKQKFLSRYWNK